MRCRKDPHFFGGRYLWVLASPIALREKTFVSRHLWRSQTRMHEWQSVKMALLGPRSDQSKELTGYCTSTSKYPIFHFIKISKWIIIAVHQNPGTRALMKPTTHALKWKKSLNLTVAIRSLKSTALIALFLKSRILGLVCFGFTLFENVLLPCTIYAADYHR